MEKSRIYLDGWILYEFISYLLSKLFRATTPAIQAGDPNFLSMFLRIYNCYEKTANYFRLFFLKEKYK
jgi:hypothetical protein